MNPEGFLGLSSKTWLVIGFVGQGLFGGRMLIQWLCSEAKQESHIPIIFWYLSVFGGITLLLYAISRKDPVIIWGQSMGLIVYSRNLMLIYGKERKERLQQKHA